LKNIKTIIASQLDENQVGFLISMINQAYVESEGDIWKDEHQRITKTALLEIIDKRELLLAVNGDSICGCIHLEPMSKVMSKFKMLVANPLFKGVGVGSVLVKFAENEALKSGAAKMQLELLVPTGYKHSDKIFLNSWYTRIGYQKTAEHDVNYLDPGLTKLLKTDCVAEIYQKVL
jgi:GNAT superfamily N-acetyltransferase